jgi:hypothetical protein
MAAARVLVAALVEARRWLLAGRLGPHSLCRSTAAQVPPDRHLPLHIISGSAGACPRQRLSGRPTQALQEPGTTASGERQNINQQ